MRKSLVVAGASLILLAAGFWFFGRPAYRRQQEERATARAVAFLEAKDLASASLSARQALALNARNLEACLVMAQAAELARAPQAIDWRRRIVELQPSIENKLTLARTALRIQGPPFPLAAQTLDELAPSAANRAPFHVLGAELAMKLNQSAEAEAHFEAARQLEPDNDLHTFNLAVLRLRSTNGALASEARVWLEQLSGRTNLAPVALRWLVADSLARSDLARAETLSDELLRTEDSLADRLQHLSILKSASRPEFGARLAALEGAVSTNAEEIHAVTGWLAAHGLSDEALTWLRGLPAEMRERQPVPLAFADAYLAKRDWKEFESWLQEERWDEMEFLRLAFLSVATARLGHDDAAGGQWRLALHQAGDRLGPLTSLLNLSRSWRPELVQAQEDLLWRIVRRFPREAWAYADLDRLLAQQRDTRGLHRLASTVLLASPGNLAARNNYAATAMLLGTNLSRAFDMAREVRRQNTNDAVLASTYAYSLHLQGRSGEGLAVLGQCQREELERPAVALYYGILLLANGQANQAREYLAISRKGALLPEERELLEKALPSQ